jgi:mannose-6-phosphate isomerase-like protein (cupin superfamily)
MWTRSFARLVVLVVVALAACDDEVAPAAPAPVSSVESVEPEPRDSPPPRALLDELQTAGPLVRIGTLALAANERVHVAADACTEVLVRVEEGALDGHVAETTGIARAPFELRATEPTRLFFAAVRPEDAPFGAPCSRDDSAVLRWLPAPEVLPFAGGKLRVRIFADASSDARFGALSMLDGDADLPVPPHVHEASVEALLVREGDGTMLQGEAESAIAPGRVLYVPPGVRHGYTPGTTKLVAYQIYAPGGPEQRFRTPPAPPAFAPRE